MPEAPVTRTTVREIAGKGQDRMLTLIRALERRLGKLEGALRVEPVVNVENVLDVCRQLGFDQEPEFLCDWLKDKLSDRGRNGARP